MTVTYSLTVSREATQMCTMVEKKEDFLIVNVLVSHVNMSYSISLFVLISVKGFSVVDRKKP